MSQIAINLGGCDDFQGVFASPPSGAEEGWTYINSVDYGFYVYAGGIWWLWTTLTPTSSSEYQLLLEDGSGILFENGDFAVTENALPPSTSAVLLEDGFDVLLESGSKLFLEDYAPVEPVGTSNFTFIDGSTFNFIDGTIFEVI